MSKGSLSLVAIRTGHRRTSNAVAEEIDAAGGQATAHRLDVAAADEWTELAAHVAERHGRIEVVHSNAARMIVKPADQLSAAEWHAQLRVTLTGAWLGVRTFAAELRHSQGTIVMTSSCTRCSGCPDIRPTLGRRATHALTRHLAVDLGPAVRVNCVLPGPILTAMWDRIGDAKRTASAAATVAQRLGWPEEASSVVAFLASDDALFVTGASVVVDGGWTIRKESA